MIRDVIVRCQKGMFSTVSRLYIHRISIRIIDSICSGLMSGSRFLGRKYLMLSRGKGRDSAEKRIVFPMKLEGDHKRKGATKRRTTTVE
jgi:hypothetical protein